MILWFVPTVLKWLQIKMWYIRPYEHATNNTILFETCNVLNIEHVSSSYCTLGTPWSAANYYRSPILQIEYNTSCPSQCITGATDGLRTSKALVYRVGLGVSITSSETLLQFPLFIPLYFLQWGHSQGHSKHPPKAKVKPLLGFSTVVEIRDLLEI